MRSIRVFLIVLSACFLAGCNDSIETKEFDFSRLEGRWEDASSDNEHFEEWKLTEDGFLVGKGYVLASSDTVFIEHLEIRNVNDTLTYIAKVSNQNNNEAIEFKMRSLGPNEIVFENLNHDFPQRIGYEIKSSLELHAYIEGTKSGEFRKTRFFYVRSSAVE
jgi:hypothetical protein